MFNFNELAQRNTYDLPNHEKSYSFHIPYLILVDAHVGMHKADEPKSVAVALITDQLEEWYAYIKQGDIPIKYDLKVRDSSAHDGFVIIDPEGYYMEFDKFYPHDQNSTLLEKLGSGHSV